MGENEGAAPASGPVGSAESGRPDRSLTLSLSSFNCRVRGNLSGARACCGGVAEMQPGQALHLVWREAGRPTGGVLPLHLLVNGAHPRIVLVDLLIPRQAEGGVDPVGDAGPPGAVVDGDPNRPVQDAGGVEDVVDLLVLQQAVCMNPGARDVEAGAGKGIV